MRRLPSIVLSVEKGRKYSQKGSLCARIRITYRYFGFGIHEHIRSYDLGIKYDPSIGIYGIDFHVVRTERTRKRSRFGIKHQITKDESMK